MIMLVSSGVVGGMNLIYNLAVAHSLGAEGFGHASAVYTVLMLLSSITLSFQLLCSKFVAKNDFIPAKVGIYRFLHRRAWLVGVAVTLLLVYCSGSVAHYLNLPTSSYILLLAGGVIFYIPLGARRGLMQGMYDFPHLATNFVLEVVVKLAGAILLIRLGYGVDGVIGAMVASIVLAYFFARPHRDLTIDATAGLPQALGEGVQATVFFVGQVIINNLDIVLVKHFFSATEAGLYAAVALVGRVVYMLSWSVVSSMFPFSAGVRSHERDGRAVLSTALLLVVLITSLFTLGVWLAPARLWQMLLGSGFPLGLHHSYSSLLVLYAATTGLYSLCVVLMSYEISRKIGNVSWLQLGFSAAIIAGIYLIHRNLSQVIVVQLVLMLALLVTVSIPFLRSRERASASGEDMLYSKLTKLRRVSEQEVIAEFLRSEFYQPEFDAYRERFQKIVTSPDLHNAGENKIRRALLFRRRGRLWRELPADTEWWEVELQNDDVQRLRVFPRNHWRRLADRSFYLSDMSERIRERVGSNASDTFVTKLRSLTSQLPNGLDANAVLLIGIDESSPLTIIEGNHRMAAASLVFPGDIHRRFRFLCGFSPRMTECCWYQTDFSTLLRYARNFVTYWLEEPPDVAIERALRSRLEYTPRTPSH
ncbi:MAG TPA: oligosaccharide flippase family protein [Terriglobales bacterium]|nr:oligosaccharide flippase family protein [Terriglobales bacterium]